LDHSADELDRRPTFSLDDEDYDDIHDEDEGVFHEDPLVKKLTRFPWFEPRSSHHANLLIAQSEKSN